MKLNFTVAFIMAAFAFLSNEAERGIISRGSLSTEQIVYLVSGFGASVVFFYVGIWFVRKMIKK